MEVTVGGCIRCDEGDSGSRREFFFAQSRILLFRLERKTSYGNNLEYLE
jgi:hypothetical protein